MQFWQMKDVADENQLHKTKDAPDTVQHLTAGCRMQPHAEHNEQAAEVVSRHISAENKMETIFPQVVENEWTRVLGDHELRS